MATARRATAKCRRVASFVSGTGPIDPSRAIGLTCPVPGPAIGSVSQTEVSEWLPADTLPPPAVAAYPRFW
jgi:hypothetical protein